MFGYPPTCKQSKGIEFPHVEDVFQVLNDVKVQMFQQNKIVVSILNIITAAHPNNSYEFRL